MPRSCWQCLGAKRWTLPRSGLPCGTFVPRPPFTGPDAQRVSRAGCAEGPGLPQDSLGADGEGSCGVHRDPSSRVPEAAADLLMYRHLLPEQHLCVRLLLLPPRLSPSLATQASHLADPFTTPRRADGDNKPLHLAMTVFSVALGTQNRAREGPREAPAGSEHQPRTPSAAPGPVGPEFLKERALLRPHKQPGLRKSQSGPAWLGGQGCLVHFG